LFGFSAECLIPTLLCSFFLDLAQKLVVESLSIDDQFMSTFLQPSYVLARHSSVIHIKRDDKGAIRSSKYVWAHRDMQPWGQPLPAQCPQCKSFRSWGKRKNTQSTAEFRCEAKRKQGDCNYLFVVEQPGNIVRSKGDWIDVSWPPPKGKNMI
jgi:hypothetical protein